MICIFVEMTHTTLHIKNMVCNRCIQSVNDPLTDLGLNIEKIELGEAIIRQEINSIEKEQVRQVLFENGFELIDDKTCQQNQAMIIPI